MYTVRLYIYIYISVMIECIQYIPGCKQFAGLDVEDIFSKWAAAYDIYDTVGT